MSDDKDRVRQEVSEFYARSVTADASFCCGCGLPEGGGVDVAKIVEAVSGKVWSAKFHARKPG
jgi:hypothetical protein